MQCLQQCRKVIIIGLKCSLDLHCAFISAFVGWLVYEAQLKIAISLFQTRRVGPRRPVSAFLQVTEVIGAIFTAPTSTKRLNSVWRAVQLFASGRVVITHILTLLCFRQCQQLCFWAWASHSRKAVKMPPRSDITQELAVKASLSSSQTHSAESTFLSLEGSIVYLRTKVTNNKSELLNFAESVHFVNFYYSFCSLINNV